MCVAIGSVVKDATFNRAIGCPLPLGQAVNFTLNYQQCAVLSNHLQIQVTKTWLRAHKRPTTPQKAQGQEMQICAPMTEGQSWQFPVQGQAILSL